jgi:uncharacterized protein
MTSTSLSATDVIRLLDLAPHPEGGHFRETFRDSVTDPSGRAASTAIYFLLAAGEVSRWHRVDAAEAWHWHAGAPLALAISDMAGGRRSIRLGADLAAGERPQAGCRSAPGSRPPASAPGRWSAAPWRRASSSQASRWPRQASNHSKTQAHEGNREALQFCRAPPSSTASAPVRARLACGALDVFPGEQAAFVPTTCPAHATQALHVMQHCARCSFACDATTE